MGQTIHCDFDQFCRPFLVKPSSKAQRVVFIGNAKILANKFANNGFTIKSLFQRDPDDLGSEDKLYSSNMEHAGRSKRVPKVTLSFTPESHQSLPLFDLITLLLHVTCKYKNKQIICLVCGDCITGLAWATEPIQQFHLFATNVVPSQNEIDSEQYNLFQHGVE
eukprot:c821_g1_i1.p1 GENE.c821_g1_i1~~c821_g1_i1.p1  ORF type:complete len:164 (+),score=22.19 c821_g1_i1:476-967(+)